MHDLVGVPPGANEISHQPHRSVDVVEERSVAAAEVVQPRFAVGREYETVLGALAVAGEPYVAAPAVLGQRIEFVLTEGSLLRRGDELDELGLHHIAEQVLRLDEVITRVEVAVVLECDGITTRASEDAHGRGKLEPGSERGVEHLDEHLTDVVSHPLVVDGDEEGAPRIGIDRAVGDAVVAEIVVGWFGPRFALDDRDELDVAKAQVVSEVPVDIERVALVRCVHGAEDVDLHRMRTEMCQPGQDPVGARPTLLVDPVVVVEFGWTVDAEADEEVVLREERRPLVGEQRSVGLDGVQEALARPSESFGQLDRSTEEVQTHERRLATLPGDAHLAVGV